MADLRSLRLDPQTLILLAIILGLLGIGYLGGYYKGVRGVEAQIVDQGGQVQLTGTVKSTNDDGFTVKTSQGDWTVKYGKQKSISGGPGSSGSGGSNDQDLQKDDEVQVSGTPIGTNSVVAQSVTKVVQPTPQPDRSQSPSSTRPPN